MEGVWSLLGLEPTTDETAIRRAYARRLKLTRPDEDPEGFQALLAARERAIAEARRCPVPLMPDRLEPVAEFDSTDVTDIGAPLQPRQESPVPIVRDDVAEHRFGEGIEIVFVRDTASPSPIAETSFSQPILQVPIPQVIDVAPLEAGPAEWNAARVLAGSVPSLGQNGGQDFATWVAAAQCLPHGPRREVEAALLQALFGAWHDPEGRLTVRRVARTRAAVLQAAPVFGWPREDAVLAASLPPHNAALMVQVLRDLLPAETDDPVVAMVPVRFNKCLPLQASDARPFLEASPHALKAYEAMRQRGPVTRRAPVFALLAPHLWALAHKRWGVAIVVLIAQWTSFFFSQAAIAEAGAAAFMLGVVAILIWLGTALATAFAADRIQIAAAAHAARRAARKGVYASNDRTARLRKAGQLLGFWRWAMIAWWGAALLFVPYFGLIILVGHALGLDLKHSQGD